MKNISVIISILILFSCGDKKENRIIPEEIYKYDNEFSLRKDRIAFIDSLLEIYSYSEYLHGIKIMEIANNISRKRAIEYNNSVLPEKSIYGTFISMGLGYIIINGKNLDSYKSNERNSSIIPMIYKPLFESLHEDKKNVNIWTRIGLAKVYDAYSQYDEAREYYEDALAINPLNADLLYSYSKFLVNSMENYGYAEDLLNEIPAIYKPDSVQKLKEIIEEKRNAEEQPK